MAAATACGAIQVDVIVIFPAVLAHAVLFIFVSIDQTAVRSIVVVG